MESESERLQGLPWMPKAQIKRLAAENARLRERVAELERNRLAGFTDEELKELRLQGVLGLDLWREAKAELARREGSNEQ